MYVIFKNYYFNKNYKIKFRKQKICKKIILLQKKKSIILKNDNPKMKLEYKFEDKTIEMEFQCLDRNRS